MKEEPTVSDLLETLGGRIVRTHAALRADDEPVEHDPACSGPTKENVLFLLGQLKRQTRDYQDVVIDRGEWRWWAEELFRMLPSRGRTS